MLNNKLGLMSIILLGVNAIIGTGIFLLPGKAAALVGVNSLWVIVCLLHFALQNWVSC